MLSVCQCLTQILNMRIMWGRDVDNVYIRIGKDIFKVIIYLGNLVFFCKCYSFFVCAVCDGIQMAVLPGKCSGKFVCNEPQPRVAQFNGFMDNSSFICIYTPFYALILA